VSIRKGEAWGTAGPLPDDGVLVLNDAHAAAVLQAAERDGQPFPVLGLLGGDLCRTLGGRGDEARLRSREAITLTVDVGRVTLDDQAPTLFIAHLRAGHSWWWGRVLFVMNASFWATDNVAPRAHPGDGLLDVVDMRLPLGDRAKARRRLASGTHVPHPAIAVRRVRTLTVDLGRAKPIELDGVKVGRARCLQVEVLADAVTVVI
jgi:YegS C-terminal NAD kinase beta sandwich-like domain